ncbi:acyl-CoA dehydrogenase family protein [Amycolatopsis suaedae]|uniref:Acyl-CoA dehydrogenase n=1 Tax=Amycolatopsis suaedae TaxID=2510978 RepID=A0A4Q7J9X1_9PSEU|nr:acyl-CoA dehydrogenase family protein [Amycolatopsis suaedae]RZQ63243.1 acyl-CoA dehydrogenase [Amycolatopsis suaedae]
MDFSHTEAQQALSGLARRILRERCDPRSWDEPGSGGFDRALWTELARAGVVDAALPSTAGGGGFGLLEQCAVLVEIGRTVAPVPYLATVTAAAAVAEFGDARQVEREVVPVARGERVLTSALADAGAPCGFTAQRTEDGWLVSGTQSTVPYAAFADAVLVPAVAADSTVLLIVGTGADGVTVEPQRTVDRGDAGLVRLTDVAVPDTAVLGSPDAAAWLRARVTVAWCALQLGVLDEALTRTAEYAKERKQFDHAIAGFQAVRQRLADGHLDVEAVRLTLWQAASRLADGLPAERDVATAKFWAAEAGHRVAHTAVHIHGGVGIDTDHPLHRYFVAAKRAEFALGGATAQLRTLGGLLAPT